MVKDISLLHSAYPSIYKKLRRVFVTLFVTLFALLWFVVYVVEDQLEVISLHHWLDSEYHRYSQEYAIHGEQTVLPNQSEFVTYWSDANVPQWLSVYKEPGLYETMRGDEDKHFLVAQHPSGKGYSI